MNHKSISKFIIGIAAAACALSISGIAMAQDSASVPADTKAQNGITVNGTFEMESMPNTAYVTLGVTTQDNTADAATRSNAAVTNAVINAVVKAGASIADIATTGYYVSPMMDYPPNKVGEDTTGYSTPGYPVNKAAVVVGYQVSNRCRVRVRDLGKLSAVIDGATNAGANDVQGIKYTDEADVADKKHALHEALLDAKLKAQIIANTLGVELGKVISVNETGNMPPRPIEQAMSAITAKATPIIPGKLLTTVTVTVVFSIL